MAGHMLLLVLVLAQLLSSSAVQGSQILTFVGESTSLRLKSLAKGEPVTLSFQSPRVNRMSSLVFFRGTDEQPVCSFSDEDNTCKDSYNIQCSRYAQSVSIRECQLKIDSVTCETVGEYHAPFADSGSNPNKSIQVGLLEEKQISATSNVVSTRQLELLCTANIGTQQTKKIEWIMKKANKISPVRTASQPSVTIDDEVKPAGKDQCPYRRTTTLRIANLAEEMLGVQYGCKYTTDNSVDSDFFPVLSKAEVKFDGNICNVTAGFPRPANPKPLVDGKKTPLDGLAPGTYRVLCEVSNGLGSASDSKNIKVSPGGIKSTLPTPPQSTAAPGAYGSGSKLTGAAIVGIVIAAVAIFIVIVVGIYCICCRTRKGEDKEIKKGLPLETASAASRQSLPPQSPNAVQVSPAKTSSSTPPAYTTGVPPSSDGFIYTQKNFENTARSRQPIVGPSESLDYVPDLVNNMDSYDPKLNTGTYDPNMAGYEKMVDYSAQPYHGAHYNASRPGYPYQTAA